MRKLCLFEKYGVEDYLKRKKPKEKDEMDEIKDAVETTQATLEK